MTPTGDPLLRRSQAPPVRTLVDIFRATAAQAADESAVDAGAGVLTYAELEEAADLLAAELNGHGIGPGGRVGVRVSSGTTDLYVAILGVLLAGAAYVPVDADDPDARARLVFDEAQVAAVIGNDLALTVRRPGAPLEPVSPSPDDDAWIIFTSGSTGKPKGVAVTHRNAAAFVDAESSMFLPAEPLGVGDRVMAGLSVAFDASCEEMWLAWRYGGALVPAPRALVRSGVDVGPWLVANRITVVSTVPTLVALWPIESLERVRLLIMGGEACPAELVTRLVAPGREVWNTYGPTEATVVACGAELTGDGPVRIGLPLAGWDLAVVDAEGRPVAVGETGELIIGGVGLARYLDPAKDAEKYAPMPTLGWERAYRSGDLVVHDPEGLLFGGRADDQVKLGGRRIELGEIDSALLAQPGVLSAAAAVRRTAAGNQLLVGYVTTGEAYAAATVLDGLRRDLPAALVPRLAPVAELPTRISGKVDRDALPWPPPPAPGESDTAAGAELSGTAAWIADLWLEILGARVTAPTDDFFDLGGGSLTAAQMVSRLRVRYPETAVGDIYERPTVADLADYLEGQGEGPTAGYDDARSVPPTPPKTQAGQVVGTIALRSVAAPRWLTWVLLGCGFASGALGATWLPTAPWWLLVPAVLVFLTPPGRMLLAAGAARLLLRPVVPGAHPRGGKIHLRLWLAERVVEELGALSLSGAPWMIWYARLLGAEVGRGVDLHSVPPVTGLLRLGKDCSIEPEVDLAGHWIDGDVLHVGAIRVRARGRVGARSMLCPGADIGSDAEVAPGSSVFGRVSSGDLWSGSPATRVGPARGPWEGIPQNRRRWLAAYAAVAWLISILPGTAVLVGVAVVVALTGVPDGYADVLAALVWLPVGTVVAFAALAGLVLALVRVAGRWITPGVHAVRGGPALAVWATMRVLDDARTWLFPLYSSMLTPTWLRLLGARIGRDVEASTVLMVPGLTQVNDQAFLADDTLIGGYELGGGWMRVERVKIGKRAFVGNSGMAAPGRKVPKAALVAVLSAAPRRKSIKSGESYLGSPPAPLRRAAASADSGRTYEPPVRLKLARAAVEAGRVIPQSLAAGLSVLVVLALVALLDRAGLVAALVLTGPVLAIAGLVAAVVAILAKWVLTGRMRPGEHPLWSSFVWRNELADMFVEVLAAPWFARAVAGTPLLNLWLRGMGATIGRGVWCETYWLPEADLIELRDGATVNRGTVVQTHLFHDRMLSMGPVVLRRGATLGPNSVILPAATLGRHATVGPVSLVMRGESVPDKTTWIGNPIGPWDRTVEGPS